jgi:L-lactate dehydrogenase (cytochrome)
MSSPTITCIEDLRALARRRIPRAIFEYADHGSYDEVTLRRNRADLDALTFRPRVMVDFSSLDCATTLLGEPAVMPLAIGPTGLTGLFHANGEMLGARAAESFGIPFTLSTMSICSIEDVGSVTTRPFWFQLYLMRDRGFSAELIARAQAARCSTLMLTVDMQIQGFRRRDPKNGLAVPPRLTLANLVDVARRPAWALKVLFGRRRTFGNLVGRMPHTGGLSTLAQWIATQFDPTVTWKDIAWVRERWPGKLMVKGIMDAEDVAAAIGTGVDAVVVSNHGGRQLDGGPSSIAVLPEVVDAAAGRCEVLFDGGIRSGQDLLKALALGARGGFIGKAFLYALAAGGERGVTTALELIRNELRVSMALAGRTRVAEIDASILRGQSGERN